jgi:hypothetical protein
MSVMSEDGLHQAWFDEYPVSVLAIHENFRNVLGHEELKQGHAMSVR